ncbi:hypothetical protein RFM68_26155 [Mesorhizobium sp. MSK_1335]|uniref:Uncharacterized protein n=1 Tax=Mesorhizobium montanum TaxID=3072323 RepID=A0ABU4ZRD9_9HYPH|nr:hypothetical protein [Mesorhizobium sp. MSK_1335]MDX8527970.1 hypothetical protein [Mesorhizobium sp. MSK_1335]
MTLVDTLRAELLIVSAAMQPASDLPQPTAQRCGARDAYADFATLFCRGKLPPQQ